MVDLEKKVAPEHVFHFSDGNKAHNLKDLQKKINDLDDEAFQHHVDESNNDFANWVEFVYKNSSLAEDLRKASNKKEMVEIIGTELGAYGGDSIKDDPVEEKKQPFEDPVSLTPPPDTQTTVEGHTIHSISTEAPHTFIVKEFFFGFVVGLLVGLLILASIMHFGLIPGVC